MVYIDKYSKPLIKGPKAGARVIVMDVDYKKKLFASAVSIALVFSSLMLLTGAQAGAEDDLEVSNLYELTGNPPPRANIPYDFFVGWKNTGDDSYDATVRLFSDCDQDDLADESSTIAMGAGEDGSVTLSVTFTEVGEICYSATIYYALTDYGEFENYINVEPETGDADLWIEFDMEGNQASPGEEVSVIFEYGNEGDVSTLNPVTFMAYFDPLDDNATNSFDPSPLTFDFLSPPPSDAPPEPERMEWYHTIPSDTDEGRYKFTIVIDSDENNTDEDPDLDNNNAEFEMCIGDCSEPDLKIWDNGIDSIRAEPIDPISGNTVTFKYSIENAGEGDAEPPGPFDEEDGELVMHLEVMKCPDGDCSEQTWVFVNQSKSIRTPIGAGEIFTSDAILAANWSTTSDDAGFWNVRIVVDGENVIDETDEDNNNLDWFKVYDEYFELKEQRPDLIVNSIDEGQGKVYQNDPRTIQIAVTQSILGDLMADDADVFIKIRDPDMSVIDWFKIDDSKTVGFPPETTLFEYTWTPTKLGVYEFYAWVDKDDTVLEWDDTNNQYDSDKYVEVFEKLPDLQVVSVSVAPLNDDGYAMVGVSSDFTATIANVGVRNMTASEGSKLEVTFYTAAPISAQLALINVDQALAMGESIDISIPFRFLENAQYRLVAKVDEAKLIQEEDEWNNEDYKNIYAVSSMDAYVSNLSVAVNDGLAGKDHPITFDLGMSNIPEEGTYRLHFNVSIDGTFGFGEVLAVAMENMTGFYPIGTGYQVGSCTGKASDGSTLSTRTDCEAEAQKMGNDYPTWKSGPYGFIDFNSSYNHQSVVMPWIPSADRTDDYVVLVEVSSDINVVFDNDAANVSISIEKLTTNLLVESIKVTEADGSATIKVTVGYPQGEQSQLDTDVALKVYRASDYAEGGAPIDELTTKTITGLLKGDSRPISFTWAVKNGDYIFVAVVDPDNQVKEINEIDNEFPSQDVTFGGSTSVDPTNEEDEGLFGLPAPSMAIAMGMLGLVALARRRS
jgi:hypothetical protein